MPATTKDQMTPKERYEAVLYGKPHDRVPCSLNVGNRAAGLLGVSPRELAGSSKLQAEGILAAYRTFGVELVGPHANILSAMGLKYVYPENSTPYVAEPLVTDQASLDRLEIPDFRAAPSMKVFWETLDRIVAEVGDEVPISIGMSGPFSASAHLRGIQDFMRDLYNQTDFAHNLLRFALEATQAFVREVGKYGVRFGIFDPTASGALISPKQYRAFSLPYEKELVDTMIASGDDKPMLHICGNTTKIWKDMVATGAGILSLDNIIDLEAAKNEVGDQVVLMGNVKPTESMLSGTTIDVEADAVACIKKTADSPKGYLMALGCGLPLQTPAENIHALVAATRAHGALRN